MCPRIFQGKWNILFKINAAANFKPFQVPRTIGSVYEKFSLMTYDACATDARASLVLPTAFNF